MEQEVVAWGCRVATCMTAIAVALRVVLALDLKDLPAFAASWVEEYYPTFITRILLSWLVCALLIAGLLSVVTLIAITVMKPQWFGR